MLPGPQAVQTHTGLEFVLHTVGLEEDPFGRLVQVSAALPNGQEIGFIRFHLVHPDNHVKSPRAHNFKISVAHEFQNQGVGTELYRAVKNIIGPEGVFLGGSNSLSTYFCKHKLGLPFDVSHFELRRRGITNHIEFASHVGFDSFEELRQFCKSIGPKLGQN